MAPLSGELSPKVTERLSQICCDLSVSASPSHLPWEGRLWNCASLWLPLVGEAFQEILTQKKLKKSDVIRNSGIDRGYAYDILSDKKQPSRDKVLLLCLGASFSFEEVQTLLKQTGYPMLYARIARDSAIIFAFRHHMSPIDTNELLYELQFDLLS